MDLASFNAETGMLEIQAPKVDHDQEFEMTIEAKVVDTQEVYLKTVTIEVLSCKVDDCAFCHPEDTSICSEST